MKWVSPQLMEGRLQLLRLRHLLFALRLAVFFDGVFLGDENDAVHRILPRVHILMAHVMREKRLGRTDLFPRSVQQLGITLVCTSGRLREEEFLSRADVDLFLWRSIAPASLLTLSIICRSRPLVIQSLANDVSNMSFWFILMELCLCNRGSQKWCRR